MIVVYPMLTSSSVNPKILPGLIKTIEKYILVYNMDEVLHLVNNSFASKASGAIKGGLSLAAAGVTIAAGIASLKNANNKVIKKGKKLELKEQRAVNIKPSPPPAQSSKPNPSTWTKAANNVAGAVDDLNDSIKDATIKNFEMPKYDNVSLEPTWVQVNTNSGAKILGIKVVPFKVESTSGMVGLLMNDRELKKMGFLANKLGRTAIRVLFRLMRGRKIPGFSGKALTGDIKKDIVWATSQYGKNTFVCFSQLDIERDDMFSTPAAVQKLYKLGWASLVVTDDVNKQATFCMKEFGGICSVIPYSHMFASLGKEHHQVYSDLEDAQRSAGPFFRNKGTSKRKLFS